MTSIEELWAEDIPDPNEGGGGFSLEAGEYNGTLTSAEVGPHDYFDGVTEFKYGIQTDDGPKVKGGVELAPFKDKNGNTSPGKIKFAKWQIKSVLGYNGSLSDLPSVAQSFVGKRVRFRLKPSPTGYLEAALLELLSPAVGVVDQLADTFEANEVTDDVVI